MWPSTQPPNNTRQTLTRRVQALVREARCYPPEREPRIVHDVSDCCQHYPGLRPRLEYYVYDSRQSIRLLTLDGVIPIIYRQVRYQIPICIWCMPHYPNEPPVPYVRPTSTMVIREHHSNVDAEGRVYLPHYISIWDPTQFTFHGLVVSMTRVFTAEPPVNSLPVRAPAVDAPERRQLIAVLTKKMVERFTEANDDAIQEIASLLAKKDDLIKSGESATAEKRARAVEYKNADEEHKALEAQRQALREWVKSVGDMREDLEIDDMLRYRDVLDEQNTDCTAQDSAFTDAMDQVDEAFVYGVIDQEKYMKEIRRISNKQFFPRALRRKIERTVAAKEVTDAAGVPRRLMSTRTTHMYAS